jgi:ankyrin repeat protein
LHKRRHDDLKSDNDDETECHQGEARDGNGMTELISKAAVGDRRAVKKLLAAGADPNLSDTRDLQLYILRRFTGTSRL